MGILSAFRFAFQNVFFTPVLYGVIASLAIFSATWEKGDRLKDQLTDQFRSQQDTFDFIIVGGGSAGAVVANRLSKHHTVLLLEAGGESHPFQAIPALSLFIPNYPATDWSHKSVPQTTSCLACKGKRYSFSQGKNLGGSGNLNYLMHLRGSPKDFDNWGRITGDDRWSYQGVLNDFTASEDFVGETTDPIARGVGGPLQIEMPAEIGLANEWNFAGREMGYPHLDLNGKYDEGFDALYYPIKKGVRQATYRSFIQPVRARSSLLIRKFAHVNKVLIREGTNDAYGVQYDRHGKNCFAFANKEVILSAGALQTPKILMLSGIGPPSVLNPFNIPVKAALPVGQNLHDHISTLVGPFFINSPKTFSFDDSITPKSFLQFTQHGTGPLTTSGFQATALVTSSYAKANGQVGWPDIQLTLLGLSPHRLFSADMAHVFGLRENILQRFFLHAMRKKAFFIVVSVARPESRGEVCLKSANPYKPLIIDPKYFSDPGGKDMAVMIEGINRALFLAENTTEFRNCGSHLTPKCFPLCENHPFRSNAYWECYVRHMTITLNDHVGTAPMGYTTSPFSVVDAQLQVMGVQNLRVIDASVMPTIVGANTQAATIMIGEKGAQFILQKWKHDEKNFDAKNVPQYGPPPLPQNNEVQPQDAYGAPAPSPQDQYGAPVPVPVVGKVKVVVDDSLGHLTPPPPLPLGVENYENYDSYNLLKNKGLDTLGSGSNGAKSSEPIPVAGFPVSTSPSSFSSSVSPYPTQLVTPTSPQPLTSATSLLSPSPPPTSFTSSTSSFNPPQIYQEIYDPVTPSTSSPSILGSSSPSSRGPKALDFSSFTPENLQDVSSSSTNPTTSSSENSTESFLSKGPGGRTVFVRRYRKRPPNVTVHPRGHLGYEDPERSPKSLLGGVTQSPLNSISTTSIHPLPKDYVVIKQRRPVNPTRRQRVPSTSSPTTIAPNVEQLAPNVSKSKSVSDVLNRLRNFIPPSSSSTFTRRIRGREKREEYSMTTALPSYFYGNGSTLEETEETTEKSKEDKDEPMLEISEILGENGEGDMLVFDNLDISQIPDDVNSIGNGTYVEKNSTNTESRISTTSNNPLKEDDEEGKEMHPFIPLDMDPLPKIIASSSDSSGDNLENNSNSTPISINNSSKSFVKNFSRMSLEERRSRMAKFVRKKS